MGAPFTMLCSALAGVTMAVVIYWLWPSVVPPPPGAGERGLQRTEALKKSGLFRVIEPLIRVLSTHMSRLPLDRLRRRSEARLIRAGRPLGFDADDLFAAALVSATVGAIGCGLMCAVLGRGWGAGVVVGWFVGLMYPSFKVDGLGRRRRIAICRGLPHAIDLAALSLEAGLDFPGAVAQVIAQLTPDNPVRFEFQHLLQKLSLGWSRQDALEALAIRTPAPQVRQFTNAVRQAEKSGTPLAQVLTTQADIMRIERSQSAEQAAARAGLLILGPLMLIFCCVFIILLGPFVIKFVRGDLF